jgi:hypothetical protein
VLDRGNGLWDGLKIPKTTLKITLELDSNEPEKTLESTLEITLELHSKQVENYTRNEWRTTLQTNGERPKDICIVEFFNDVLSLIASASRNLKIHSKRV